MSESSWSLIDGEWIFTGTHERQFPPANVDLGQPRAVEMRELAESDAVSNETRKKEAP